MKKALVILVGNRDLQIPANYRGELKGKFLDHLEENNDGNSVNLVIKKGRNESKTFREVSKEFLNERETLKPFLSFPMLDRTLEEMGDLPDKVIISGSDQGDTSFNRQDTLHICTMMGKYLEDRGIHYELKLCSENPTRTEPMMVFYSQLFAEISKQGYHLFVSNSGGTPTMRTASHMAGLFQGYVYITISGTDNTNLKPYNSLENMILGHIVKEMLKVYNYEGINQLPQVSPKVKALAAYAKARIALDFKLARKHLEPWIDDLEFKNWYDTIEDKKSLKDKEREMYQSAKIKFEQANYADFLWRIFTISENMFKPALEQMLGGKVEHDRKSGHASWNNLLQKDKELIEALDKILIRNNPLDYSEPSNYVLTQVYQVLTQKLARQIVSDNEKKLVKNLESLKQLRNDIAHSYGFNPKQDIEGVGIEEINNRLGKKSTITDFNNRLATFVGIPWNDFGDYSDINKRILNEVLTVK